MFQASTVVYMRSALLCNFMQHRLVVCYQCFRSTYQSHLKAMGMKENNLDDERMPNYPVAYIVQIMNMRNSPHEQLVGVPTSPIMFQLSSKFFQVQ